MVTIRPWTADDRAVLLPMLMDLLANNVEAGGELLPTERNAHVLVDLGLKWAAAGEPTLVACDVSGAVVAFTLWGSLGNPMGLDTRDNLCTGIGTYVVPGWRRRYVSCKLRREAFEVARRKRYDRVLGVAYHEAGLQSMLRIGAKAIGTVTEWHI